MNKTLTFKSFVESIIVLSILLSISVVILYYYTPTKYLVIKQEPTYIYVNQSTLIESQLAKQIELTLKYLNLYSEDVHYLLMFTASIESNLGKMIKQINGPAEGIFQMEPSTEAYIMKWLDKPKNKELKAKVLSLIPSKTIKGTSHMQTVLPYQIAMARIYYFMDKTPIPKRTDKDNVYYVYKNIWNTVKGKSTKDRSLEKVSKLLAEKQPIN